MNKHIYQIISRYFSRYFWHRDPKAVLPAG